jgi:hypothetical protein
MWHFPAQITPPLDFAGMQIRLERKFAILQITLNVCSIFQNKPKLLQINSILLVLASLMPALFTLICSDLFCNSAKTAASGFPKNEDVMVQHLNNKRI